jgi:hypothetical protein
MAGLNAFLSPVNSENVKTVISKRFVEDGNPVEWEIRPIGEKENNLIMKRCTKRDKKTGVDQFDRIAYAHEIAAASVVFPDLTNADLQKNYGVLGESELLQAMLYVGEFAALTEAVNGISSLDTDTDAEIESAKN